MSYCNLMKKLFQLRIMVSTINNYFLRDSSIRYFSETTNCTNNSSLTVSFLINACGLSENTALLVAKRVTVQSEKRANMVLETFRSFGFTNGEITLLISKTPRLLSSRPLESIKPKLEFYRSIGLSDVELRSVICKNGSVLSRGLKTALIPSYDYLKRYIQRKEDLLSFARKSSWFLRPTLKRVMEPNIEILRSCGVPECRILKFVSQNLRKMCTKSSKFKENVDLIMQMGIDPSTQMFLIATGAILHLNDSSWKRKTDFYKSLGWSEDQVISAFKRHPYCMLLSETKIKKSMDFFVDKFGMKPSDLCFSPVLLSYSLDKRILPRYMVIRSLLSKGILRKDLHPSTSFSIAEKCFLERYVIKYEEKIPGLLIAYRDKMDLLEFNVGSEILKKLESLEKEVQS